MEITQYDVWWVALDPTIGKEIKKTRPCVIISPDEMNNHIGTVIIAPLTSTIRLYPSRIKYELKGKVCTIALDQIKTINKSRLKNKISHLESKTIKQIRQTIEEIFCK
jgi:mRNA interferase MazF